MAEGRAVIDDAVTLDGGTAMVRASDLRKFRDVVIALGGDPVALVTRAQIDPALLDSPQAVYPYRTLIHLLERASVELDCPDFGMRLAAEKARARVLGPLEIAMSHSRTMREAFRYCADHLQAYTTGALVSIGAEGPDRSVLLRFEILLARLPYQRQAVEQALLLTHYNAEKISGGQVRAKELWFTHEPLAPIATYRAYFGGVVRFGQAMNGLLFAEGDLDMPIPNVDPQLYALATSFIERRFPATEPVLTMRVRTIIERLLLAGSCTFAGVASAMGMHPRTLQRRLRAEGDSFEGIKDGVRRDIALRYLKQSSLPLIRVAELLGYSETSVLSRSCNRWFAASPRQVRGGQGRAADGDAAPPIIPAD